MGRTRHIPPIGTKACSKCGKVKTYDLLDRKASEFYYTQRRLEDGTLRTYPSGRCKQCGRKDAREYMQKKTPAERRAARDRWNTNRRASPVKRARTRRYHRRYERRRRRQQGAKLRGPWKKYKDECVCEQDYLTVPLQPGVDHEPGCAHNTTPD